LDGIVAGLEISRVGIRAAQLEWRGAQEVQEGELVQRLRRGNPFSGNAHLPVTVRVGHNYILVLVGLPALQNTPVKA
jgi:hypothetical protein